MEKVATNPFGRIIHQMAIGSQPLRFSRIGMPSQGKSGSKTTLSDGPVHAVEFSKGGRSLAINLLWRYVFRDEAGVCVALDSVKRIPCDSFHNPGEN